MSKSSFVALGLIFALTLATAPVFAGKLREASAAARSSSSSSPSSGSSDDHDSYSHDSYSHDSSHHADNLLGLALFYVMASPWLLPNAAVEEGRAPGGASRVRFADYPYADGSDGVLRELAPVAPMSVIRGASSKAVAAQVGLEAGIGTDDGVVRSGFQARTLFPFRLGLDTSWLLYREGSGDGTDLLGRGREHLDIRFAESQYVHFQSGIGAQHLVDAQGWVNGVDVTWGFQAFPAKPVVIAAEGSLGNLGKAFAPGVRGELGLMLNRVQISAGFEERWVGPVALGGPFIAVTAWL